MTYIRVAAVIHSGVCECVCVCHTESRESFDLQATSDTDLWLKS